MPEQIIRLSWSKWIELVRIDDPWKRAFYENECLKGNWSVRQLQRQVESLLYERTGLSRNKKAVIERARRQAHETPSETIARLFVSRYLTALPSAEQLKALVEGDRARFAGPAPKRKKTR